MQMPGRIHIVGASGSGTTSLASALAARHGHGHLEEVERYGQEALGPGGTLHQAHVEFLDWAGRYDGGGPEMRSRVLHEAWLSTLPGAVLRLEGDRSVVEQLAPIQASVEAEKV